MSPQQSGFVRSVSYTALAAVVSALVSVFSVLLVPKVLSVAEYGYWSLFVFYASFVPLLQFGLSDGVYLRYGGVRYSAIDRPLFSGQALLLLFSQLGLSALMIMFAANMVTDDLRSFTVTVTAIYSILVNVRYFYLYTLQASARFDDYARVLVGDRILYLGILIPVLLIGPHDFRMLLGAELAAKTASLLWAMYLCRDIVLSKPSTLREVIGETGANVAAGLTLTIANTAGMLIVGVARAFVDRVFGVASFGKVSLALNISNFAMVLINAVGIVLFPFLRRAGTERMRGLFSDIRTLLMPFLLACLFLYYPLSWVLSYWLPQYRDSIHYLALILPIAIFEGKMAILVNSYYKTLRWEKRLLGLNLLVLLLSAAMSAFSSLYLGRLELVVLSIVVALGVRSTLGEVVLAREFGVRVGASLLVEAMLIILFLTSAWFDPGPGSATLFALVYGVYFLFTRKRIAHAYQALQTR